MAGAGERMNTPAQVVYGEGAAIGYKWYDLKGEKPLWAFGHGLSYTGFAVSDLKPRLDGDALKVSVSIRNTGKLKGKGVVQVYVAPQDWQAAGWEAPRRLGGFAKAELKPGQSKTVELTVDSRLLATYQAAGNSWAIASGSYRLLAGQASDDLPLSAEVNLPARSWSAVHASN